MKIRFLAIGCGVVAMASTGWAQAPDVPKPGVEHKALTYFVGKWNTEGEVKPGPFGPGGKVSNQESCEWFTGGFQVVCRGQGKSPMGPMSSLGILTYSDGEKAYTYYGVDNMGMAELSKGSRSGNTWTFNAKSQLEGQTFHSRYTIVESSPTAYTFKWDTSTDGTKWSTMMEGKSTKVGT